LRWGVEIFPRAEDRAEKHGTRRPSATKAASRRAANRTRAIQIVLEAMLPPATSPASKVSIALDPASSEFYDKANGNYVFQEIGQVHAHFGADGRVLDKLVEKYPLVFHRGGMAEDDWAVLDHH